MSVITTASPPTSKPLAPPDHSRSLWRSRLGSALRTALACAIVGTTTLYAPTILRRHLTFPALSYVTTVLIVGEAATLGDSLRGAACALCGTVLGLLPAVLTLYLMQPVGLSVATTAIAVSLSSFVLAISDSAGLITKRIALVQIVLVYVTAFKQGGHVNPVLHPVPVAASAAVGAVASVLALVFPYPRLAYYEVREKSKFYTEITMGRLRLLVNAFCADNSSCMVASISQAKSLTAACTKLLQNIKLMQGSMQWERPPSKFWPPHSDTLQAIETPLKGMEIALASTTSYPIKILDQHFKDNLISLRDYTSIKLGQDSLVTKEEIVDKTLQPLHVIPQNLQDLPSFFFVFCVKLLCDGILTTPSPNSTEDNKVTPTTEHTKNSCKEEEPSTRRRKLKSIWSMNISTKRLVIALKCSLSLGLAVLFGVLFSDDEGYWSGLTVATAFTPWRDATFKLASVRAHGTALGSVYGVLGSFISQNLMEVRLLVLLPWIVFTSFLQRSRMYGQAGGIAATISAVIILGRRNTGSPMLFSIDRLTETYIGLCCSIFVEILLQPTRASTLARSQLSGSLQTLHECMESLAISSVDLKEKEKKLKKRVTELRKYMGEAEVEPNFWFLPFPVVCYNKLHSSLSKMADLVVFLVHGTEVLAQESYGIQETVKGELNHFKELVCSSVKCFEEVIQVKSLAKLEGELKRKSGCNDIEPGKGQSPCGHWAVCADEEECEKVADSFLQHAKEVLERIDADVSEELKSQVVLCLATLGFCIGGLMREMREIEKGILELVQWENPSSHINLFEIFCKIKEVST